MDAQSAIRHAEIVTARAAFSSGNCDPDMQPILMYIYIYRIKS